MWSGFRSDQYLGLKDLDSICITAAQGEITDVEIRSIRPFGKWLVLYTVLGENRSLGKLSDTYSSNHASSDVFRETQFVTTVVLQ